MMYGAPLVLHPYRWRRNRCYQTLVLTSARPGGQHFSRIVQVGGTACVGSEQSGLAAEDKLPGRTGEPFRGKISGSLGKGISRSQSRKGWIGQALEAVPVGRVQASRRVSTRHALMRNAIYIRNISV